MLIQKELTGFQSLNTSREKQKRISLKRETPKGNIINQQDLSPWAEDNQYDELYLGMNSQMNRLNKSLSKSRKKDYSQAEINNQKQIQRNDRKYVQKFVDYLKMNRRYSTIQLMENQSKQGVQDKKYSNNVTTTMMSQNNINNNQLFNCQQNSMNTNQGEHEGGKIKFQSMETIQFNSNGNLLGISEKEIFTRYDQELQKCYQFQISNKKVIASSIRGSIDSIQNEYSNKKDYLQETENEIIEDENKNYVSKRESNKKMQSNFIEENNLEELKQIKLQLKQQNEEQNQKKTIFCKNLELNHKINNYNQQQNLQQHLQQKKLDLSSISPRIKLNLRKTKEKQKKFNNLINQNKNKDYKFLLNINQFKEADDIALNNSKIGEIKNKFDNILKFQQHSSLRNSPSNNDYLQETTKINLNNYSHQNNINQTQRIQSTQPQQKKTNFTNNTQLETIQKNQYQTILSQCPSNENFNNYNNGVVQISQQLNFHLQNPINNDKNLKNIQIQNNYNTFFNNHKNLISNESHLNYVNNVSFGKNQNLIRQLQEQFQLERTQANIPSQNISLRETKNKKRSVSHHLQTNNQPQFQGIKPHQPIRPQKSDQNQQDIKKLPVIIRAYQKIQPNPNIHQTIISNQINQTSFASKFHIQK